MKYRKEITGLRAIAVVPVILFHAKTFGFTGGYIGVDIFFVISGFLITSIILEELEQKSFSIVRFYERRARRILPALFIVLLFTTLSSMVLLPTDLLKNYSQSLASVAIFSSNIFFFLKSGYFSTEADEKPLLHTWSLAVEEQYYIIFPILMMLCWAISKRVIVVLISVLLVLSLLLSQYLSILGWTDANFYLITSRAWELLCGSLVAFFNLKALQRSRYCSEFASWFGFMLIVYSIFYFNGQTPFPSFYTLIPVIGVMLIIVFSTQNTSLGKLLSNSFLVGIGLISYSLYLWHQPIFAFIRLKTVGEPTIFMFVIAIVSIIYISYLSYKYVETPLRDIKRYPQQCIFMYSIVGLFIAFSIGFTGHHTNGYEQLYNENIYRNSIMASPKRSECHTRGVNYLRPNEACRYFGSNVNWASFGDSHIVELSYVLAKYLEKYDQGLLHLSFSNCSPALNFDVNTEGCSNWVQDSISYLENNKEIENVLIGFRYNAFLFGDQLDVYPRVPDENPVIVLKDENNKKVEGESVREIYWQNFKKIIDRLLVSGKTVYVLYPVPELPVHISKAVTPLSIFSDRRLIDIHHATSSKYYYSRNKFILNKLKTLTYGKNLYRINPFEIICSDGFCPAVLDNNALYFDDDHLSLEGAEIIINSSAIVGLDFSILMHDVDDRPH